VNCLKHEKNEEPSTGTQFKKQRPTSGVRLIITMILHQGRKGHSVKVTSGKEKLRPECPDALDALGISDATFLTRMQITTAPCIWTQITTASAYRMERGRGFSFWTQPCQGIFLLDVAVSRHFPSGRSRVRAFSYWMRLDDACYGSTVTLAVKV